MLKLFKCYLKTFDWTFKGGGGSLGGFLTDPEAPESQKPILEFDSDGEIIGVKELQGSNKSEICDKIYI